VVGNPQSGEAAALQAAQANAQRSRTAPGGSARELDPRQGVARPADGEPLLFFPPQGAQSAVPAVSHPQILLRCRCQMHESSCRSCDSAEKPRRQSPARPADSVLATGTFSTGSRTADERPRPLRASSSRRSSRFPLSLNCGIPGLNSRKGQRPGDRSPPFEPSRLRRPPRRDHVGTCR
jgi:hypothetical protein